MPLKSLRKINKSAANGSMLAREVGPYLVLGWQLVLTIGLMTYFGWWLDKKFETEPWLLIIFSFLGCVAGMFSMLKTILDLNKKKKTESENPDD